MWLDSSVLTAMKVEAKRSFPLETGGVLVGYASEDDAEQVLRFASGPGPGALHTTSRFVPDHDYQSEFVRMLYNRTGRTHTYLGDWHSHPNGRAAMSFTDCRTLSRIAKCKQARAPMPLMIILAGGPDEWAIAAWRRLSRRLFAAATPATLKVE